MTITIIVDDTATLRDLLKPEPVSDARLERIEREANAFVDEQRAKLSEERETERKAMRSEINQTCVTLLSMAERRDVSKDEKANLRYRAEKLKAFL